MAPGSHTPEAGRQDTTVGSGIDFGDPNSRLAPFYLRTTGVLAAGGVAALLALYSLQPLHHTDVWAHLKHGEYIAATGRLTGPEPYSPFADPGATRPAFYWLTQLGYQAMFSLGERLAGGNAAQRLAGGAELLRQVHVVAAVAAYVLFWVAYRRATGSGSLALLGLVLVFAGAAGTVGIHRPQVFALALFAAVYTLLAKPAVPRVALLLIPAIFALWVNVHGSYPVGLLLIAITLVGRAWELGGRAAVRDRDLRRLAFAAVLAAVAVSVLNPDGPRIWLETWRFSQHPNLRTMLEWQPLNFGEQGGGHWLYWAGVLLLVVAQAISPRGLSVRQALLVLAFGVPPLFQERFMAWWLPVCIGVALEHLGGWATARGLVWTPSTPTFRKTILATVLLAFGALLTPLASWAQNDRPDELAKVLHPATPYGLAETLRGGEAPERFAALRTALDRTFVRRPVGPVFCSEALGEYLYWRGLNGPQPTLFAHAHLFPPEYWTACLQARNAQPGWWEFLDRSGVNIVALEAVGPNMQPQPLAAELAKSPRWAVVIDERGRGDIRDPKARLFVAVRKVPLQP